MQTEIDSSFKIKNINESQHNFEEIPRISCEKLSYNQFFYQFMLTNTPVVLTGIKIKTEISEKWFDGNINLNAIQEDLNDHRVPVANCSKQYFDSHEKLEMKFSEFASCWKESNCDLYLKDFHLKQEVPGLDFYNTP